MRQLPRDPENETNRQEWDSWYRELIANSPLEEALSLYAVSRQINIAEEDTTDNSELLLSAISASKTDLSNINSGLDDLETLVHALPNKKDYCPKRVRIITSSTEVMENDLIIILDASAGNVTATLPATPAEGDIHYFKCKDATFLPTLGRNGKNIDGLALDVIMALGGKSQLLYDGIDSWWTIN